MSYSLIIILVSRWTSSIAIKGIPGIFFEVKIIQGIGFIIICRLKKLLGKVIEI